MKKQWIQFLNDNANEWSYGIVPSLVKRLDEALKVGDDEIVQETFNSLAAQGVILDENGNLRFIMDIGSNLDGKK